jgi:hypothetical protein
MQGKPQQLIFESIFDGPTDTVPTSQFTIKVFSADRKKTLTGSKIDDNNKIHDLDPGMLLNTKITSVDS